MKNKNWIILRIILGSISIILSICLLIHYGLNEVSGKFSFSFFGLGLVTIFSGELNFNPKSGEMSIKISKIQNTSDASLNDSRSTIWYTSKSNRSIGWYILIILLIISIIFLSLGIIEIIR